MSSFLVRWLGMSIGIMAIPHLVFVVLFNLKKIPSFKKLAGLQIWWAIGLVEIFGAIFAISEGWATVASLGIYRFLPRALKYAVVVRAIPESVQEVFGGIFLFTFNGALMTGFALVVELSVRAVLHALWPNKSMR